MKITITPTTEPEGPEECVSHEVAVTHPYDDLSMDHVAILIADALLAYGFSSKTVNDYIVTENFNWGDRE